MINIFYNKSFDYSKNKTPLKASLTIQNFLELLNHIELCIHVPTDWKLFLGKLNRQNKKFLD